MIGSLCDNSYHPVTSQHAVLSTVVDDNTTGPPCEYDHFSNASPINNIKDSSTGSPHQKLVHCIPPYHPCRRQNYRSLQGVEIHTLKAINQ